MLPELGGMRLRGALAEKWAVVFRISIAGFPFFSFQYGDYDPSVHKRGFLAQEELLPKRVRNQIPQFGKTEQIRGL